MIHKDNINKVLPNGEYIIRLNATKAPICDLCEYLDITFDELRKIYDRVYNLPLSKVGRHKRQLVF